MGKAMMQVQIARILFVSLGLVAMVGATCSGPTTMTCHKVATPVTLDGVLNEWVNVEGIETPLHTFGGTTYPQGNAMYKCSHNMTHIHFAMEVPGVYRFDAADNHKCAAVATMFKVGEKATFINMGGCTEKCTDDTIGLPESCTGHLVDIGAHWELSGTQRGQAYTINAGSGNDLIANKDDEYAVGPWCRFDDDDAAAANEWEGAWDHSSPEEGSVGKYIFELSRVFVTQSDKTDRQLAVDNTYSFGIAFWDPNGTTAGWHDDDHFLTGCGEQWLNLVVVGSIEEVGLNTDSLASSASKPSVYRARDVLGLALLGATFTFVWF